MDKLDCSNSACEWCHDDTGYPDLEGTFGYQAHQVELNASKYGAHNILASMDQLRAKMHDYQGRAIRAHFES